MTEINYASYKELAELGIKSTFRYYIKMLDMHGRRVTTNDGRKWELIPEDGIYEEVEEFTELGSDYN